MQSITFINPTGKEIIFKNAPPYVGWIYDGMGLPDSEALQDRAPGQDGYTAYNVLLGSRRIIITGHIHGPSGGNEGIREMYHFRKELMGVLNPKFGLGELIYQNDKVKWKISAFCAATPYIRKIRNFHTIEVIFECPDPFFMSMYPSIANLAYIDGDLEFPLETPGFFGNMGYEVVIDNDSDIYLPMAFEITGGSLNPTIENTTTGESFTISRSMTREETLYINTDTHRPSVQIGSIDPITNKEKRVNAWSYLKKGYDLIHFMPGENTLQFSSDNEEKDVKILITWHHKYVGG